MNVFEFSILVCLFEEIQYVFADFSRKDSFCHGCLSSDIMIKGLPPCSPFLLLFLLLIFALCGVFM